MFGAWSEEIKEHVDLCFVENKISKFDLSPHDFKFNYTSWQRIRVAIEESVARVTSVTGAGSKCSKQTLQT